MKSTACLLFFGFSLLISTHAPAAEFSPGENLVQPLPPGYKVGLTDRRGNLLLTQLVPEQQTLQDWSEMLTTQIFLGGIPQETPIDFYKAMTAAWRSACKDSSSELLRSATENGYASAFWIQVCPRDPETGKPEYSWFKAIKGENAFYVVQKAWRYEPKQDEVVNWSAYLREIHVCSTEKPASPCP